VTKRVLCTPDEDETMTELRLAGLSLALIARIMHRGKSTIQTRLMRLAEIEEATR
jgi:hypothetical protein